MNETTMDLADVKTRELMLPEMVRCWAGDLSIDQYRQYLRSVDGHPWARRQVRPFVLRDHAGKPLSSLYLHAVRASHFGESLWLGGIARVLTPEALRGRGHATELMERTLELLKKEGIAGAYLFSDIDPGFYERYGFKTVDRQGVDCPLNALPAGDADGRLRPAESGDWEAIHRLYHVAREGEAFWFLREPEHWEYLRCRSEVRSSLASGAEPKSCDLVLEREGVVTAYALAMGEEETLELTEFGMEAPSAKDLDCLLLGLRKSGEALGCRRLIAPWPPGRWRPLFETRFTPSSREDGILMIAALDDRLDVERIVDETRGSWATDRI